ncbi:MAG: transporter substrate-binding domain-containing protein [Candidatus Binatia bacterium]
MRRFTVVLFVLCFAPQTFGQPQSGKLRVATRLVRPFVYGQQGQLTGFSIELWQEIARQLNVESEFVVKPTVKELLNAVKSNEASVGIAAISITAEREIDFDFSQPMFDSGLQILTPVQGSRTALVEAIIGNLFSTTVLLYVLAVALILLLMAHLVWWFERRNPPGMLTHRAYFPGIFEACWWAASTLATQADQMPRAAMARIIAVAWMFMSVVFIAYFTAAVTSSLTVQQLRGDINGPEDLPGKRVGSIHGSTSAEYLRQRNLEPLEFAKIEEAYQALENHQIDAVVYDTPILLYYTANDGKGKAQTVGAMFRKENYGIVFPSNSPLRKRVNEALLKLKENGAYDQLYTKWFGGAGS